MKILDAWVPDNWVFSYIGIFGGIFFHTPKVLKKCLYLAFTHERRTVMSQNSNLGRQNSK
jgi:hypothetical protein